jgi:hypothetical protein
MHIPTAINAWVWHYFRTNLFPWHLAVYYCPVPEVTIHGGRGSGKTTGIALAMAAYHTLHPGEDWLHVSVTKDQAQLSYTSIINFGAQGLFNTRFVSDMVRSPFPEIRLRRWSAADPGTTFRFRSIGADDNIDRLRSFEIGTATVDEAFRLVPNPNTYPQLRGCLRGFNRVLLSLLPPEDRVQVEAAVQTALTAANEPARIKAGKELDKLVQKFHLEKRGLMALYGNAGPHDWEWQRHDRARTDPKHYFSYTTSTWDNPTITERQREDMARQFGDNKDMLMVEMYGRRPMNLGSVFPGAHLRACMDLDARPKALAMQEEHVPGWVLREHVEYGCFHYEEPPDPTRRYVVGADPGSGVSPMRNKWVIGVFDVTEKPARLVYFEMGHVNLRSAGDFRPFWARLKRVRDLYPMTTGDLWVDSTGVQKGMTQLAMPEDLAVVAVSFVGDKLVLINKLIGIFNAYAIRIPDIPQLVIEIGNYERDDKELNQDCVSMMICAAGAMWQYLGLDYVPTKAEEAEEYVEEDRYARSVDR